MEQEKENPTITASSGIKEDFTTVEMVEAKPTPVTNYLKGVAAGQDPALTSNILKRSIFE